MKQLDMEVVEGILMSMPNVQESTLHGYRAFKTRGKLLACPAIHKSAEPNSLVVKLPREERDRFLAEHPGTCYVTDHYARDAVVLVRLSEVGRNSLRSLLERAWGLLNQEPPRSGARPRIGAAALDSAPTKSRTTRSARSRAKRTSG